MMTTERPTTLIPLEVWYRLAKKARKEGIRAYRLNDDPRYWAVTSGTRPGVAYEVTVLDGDLLCSCPGSAYYPYCKHRALVLTELGILPAVPACAPSYP